VQQQVASSVQLVQLVQPEQQEQRAALPRQQLLRYRLQSLEQQRRHRLLLASLSKSLQSSSLQSSWWSSSLAPHRLAALGRPLSACGQRVARRSTTPT
jgi:hypothetical protein